MSLEDVNRARELTGWISATQRAIVMELAWRADKHHRVRATQSELSEALCMSEATVKHHLVALREVGLFERIEGKMGRYMLAILDPDFEDERTEDQVREFLDKALQDCAKYLPKRVKSSGTE